MQPMIPLPRFMLKEEISVLILRHKMEPTAHAAEEPKAASAPSISGPKDNTPLN